MMECTTSSPLQNMGQNFINPQLHTVWILALYFIMLKRWPCLGYLVDVGAAGWLLYGTMIRKLILAETHWMTDICAALHASEHKVYQFLAISLVCWVASCILEGRSLRFLWKIQPGGIPWRSVWLYFLALVTSANSCVVMLSYSTRVHKSFEFISQDEGVLSYFLLAAFSKNIRVFFQGLVFASRVGEPWVFVRENDSTKRKLMTRMALSNGVMLVQSAILLFWTWQWRIMTLMAAVDMIYRFIVILWFFANSSLLLQIRSAAHHCLLAFARGIPIRSAAHHCKSILLAFARGILIRSAAHGILIRSAAHRCKSILLAFARGILIRSAAHHCKSILLAFACGILIRSAAHRCLLAFARGIPIRSAAHRCKSILLAFARGILGYCNYVLLLFVRWNQPGDNVNEDVLPEGGAVLNNDNELVMEEVTLNKHEPHALVSRELCVRKTDGRMEMEKLDKTVSKFHSSPVPEPQLHTTPLPFP